MIRLDLGQRVDLVIDGALFRGIVAVLYFDPAQAVIRLAPLPTEPDPALWSWDDNPFTDETCV